MGSLGIVAEKTFRTPGVRMNGGNIVAGRYRVDSSLGVGPFGFVLGAHSLHVERRKVALKILASATSMSAARRALAGAHRSASLKSEHIARVIDTGFTEDAVGYIATEKLEGHSLGEELFARGTLPAWEAVRWILEACEGLAEAHAQGIVHGDLKPNNLFLAKKGDGDESRVLKILDFGMALMPFAEDECNDVESFEGNTAATAPLFASPAYLAPERLHDSSARLDPRVDIWSLGVILHQLVAGSLPFMADTVSGMLVAVAYDAPALLAAPDVPYDLARVVHACLAKDPSSRPRNVAVLAKQLAPFAGPTGEDLAARVLESARRAAPPPPPASIAAMTVNLPPPPPQATKKIPPSSPSAAPRFTQTLKGLAPFLSPPKSERKLFGFGLEALDEKAERRRRMAIGVVGVAAVLAIAGLVVPAASPRPRVGSASIHSGEMIAENNNDTTTNTNTTNTNTTNTTINTNTNTTKSEEDEERTATREVLLPARAFVPPSFGVAEPEIESVTSLPPASTPPPTPARPPIPVTASRATTPAVEPSGVKQPTPSKPKAGLLVREDPYSKGFTHPSRLTDRRK